MEPTNDLDHLALRYGSDKFGDHNYTPIYHEYFERIRDRQLHLLEIGIGGYTNPMEGGASLRMWRDYFPNSYIYGLDFYEKQGMEEERVRIFQGSQVDPRAIAKLIEATPEGMFDIIVDDGSHRCEHVIGSFMMLFPFVVDQGWYIVEDTLTSYWPHYGGVRGSPTDRLTTMAFFRQLVDGLNWRQRDHNYEPNYLDENIAAIHFYKDIIFVRKGQPG